MPEIHSNEKGIIRIELTSEQKEKVKEITKQSAEAIELTVEELEQRAELLEDEEDLPSGESLAAELTRFLRERERGNGGPERGPSEQP